jgi:hypothetical protein
MKITYYKTKHKNGVHITDSAVPPSGNFKFDAVIYRVIQKEV